jgi:hypothetical protein
LRHDFILVTEEIIEENLLGTLSAKHELAMSALKRKRPNRQGKWQRHSRTVSMNAWKKTRMAI